MSMLDGLWTIVAAGLHPNHHHLRCHCRSDRDRVRHDKVWVSDDAAEPGGCTGCFLRTWDCGTGGLLAIAEAPSPGHSSERMWDSCQSLFRDAHVPFCAGPASSASGRGGIGTTRPSSRRTTPSLPARVWHPFLKNMEGCCGSLKAYTLHQMVSRSARIACQGAALHLSRSKAGCVLARNPRGSCAAPFEMRHCFLRLQECSTSVCLTQQLLCVAQSLMPPARVVHSCALKLCCVMFNETLPHLPLYCAMLQVFGGSRAADQ